MNVELSVLQSDRLGFYILATLIDSKGYIVSSYTVRNDRSVIPALKVDAPVFWFNSPYLTEYYLNGTKLRVTSENIIYIPAATLTAAIGSETAARLVSADAEKYYALVAHLDTTHAVAVAVQHARLVCYLSPEAAVAFAAEHPELAECNESL